MAFLKEGKKEGRSAPTGGVVGQSVSEHPSPASKARRIPPKSAKINGWVRWLQPSASGRQAPLFAWWSCRMLALFLAIALLGTDGAYGRSTTDLTGDSHDNTDLGRSELHAKAGDVWYYGDDAIDFAGAKVEVDDLTGSPVTANSVIGLGPSRPSPPTPPASPSPPSPSPPPKATVGGRNSRRLDSDGTKSLVTILVAAANVRITATISMPASMTVDTIMSALTTTFGTAAAASTALGIKVESDPTIAIESPTPTIEPTSDDSPSIVTMSSRVLVIFIGLCILVGLCILICLCTFAGDFVVVCRRLLLVGHQQQPLGTATRVETPNADAA